MRKILVLGTAAVFLSLGGVAAYAENPNVPSWSQYSIMGYDATPTLQAIYTTPMTANPVTHRRLRRDAATGKYIDYKSVGLSGSHWDCNDGCAVSNGG